MKKITALTDEQISQMPAWAEKWIDIGLSTTGTDFELAEALLREVYGLAALPWHGNFIRVQSPLEGALLSGVLPGVLKNGNKVRDQVLGQVRDQVHDQVVAPVHDQVLGHVRDQVAAQVHAQVVDQVADQVDAQVADQVRDQVHELVAAQVDDQVRAQVDAQVAFQVDAQVFAPVRAQIADQVRDQVRAQVGAQVADQVRDQVHAQVGAQVRAQVDTQVRDQVDAHVGDQVLAQIEIDRSFALNWVCPQFWIGGWWGSPSYVSFFQDVCGLEISLDRHARISQELARSVNYLWLTNRYAIACSKPTHILRDDQGRLHSDQKQALEYPDGWGVYCLHGVRFDEALWRKIVNGEFKLADMATIENADQRGVAFMYSNPQSLIADSGAVKIDEGHAHNTLYKCPPQEGLFTEEQYFVHIQDVWTDREFIEWVDPEIARSTSSCDAVVAHQFGITVEEWTATEVHA